jgi:hypothetical protein
MNERNIPDGFHFDDEEEDNEEHQEYENEDEDDEPEYISIDNVSERELRRRFNIMENLVFLKDRIISSQLNHIDRLEQENKNMQNNYSSLYGAFVGLSEKARDMLKREKVLKIFLKKKDFDIQDIDEFINELKITHYYKKKNNKKEDDE